MFYFSMFSLPSNITSHIVGVRILVCVCLSVCTHITTSGSLNGLTLVDLKRNCSTASVSLEIGRAKRVLSVEAFVHISWGIPGEHRATQEVTEKQ